MNLCYSYAEVFYPVKSRMHKGTKPFLASPEEKEVKRGLSSFM
jgi:hypothetical protein